MLSVRFGAGFVTSFTRLRSVRLSTTNNVSVSAESIDQAAAADP